MLAWYIWNLRLSERAKCLEIPKEGFGPSFWETEQHRQGRSQHWLCLSRSAHTQTLTFGPGYLEKRFWLSVITQKESAPTSKWMTNLLIFFKLWASMIQEFHVFTVKPGYMDTSRASPPRSRPFGEITSHELQGMSLFHWKGQSWKAGSITGGSQTDPHPQPRSYITFLI